MSQSLATDEVLLALPLGDRLLAVSGLVDDPRYSLVLGQAGAIPRRVLRSAEEILALRPDLVFVASYTTEETVDQLRRAGAPVLQLQNFNSLDDIRANIRTTGRAVGEERQAEALVRELDRKVAAAIARARRAQSRPLRVVAWEAGVVIAGNTTFDDLITQLGAVDVAAEAGLDGWPRVGIERLAVWHPDLVILPAAPGEEAATAASLVAAPALRGSDLAEPGRVVTVPAALFNTVSHHIGELAERLAGLLVDASRTDSADGAGAELREDSEPRVVYQAPPGQGVDDAKAVGGLGGS